VSINIKDKDLFVRYVKVSYFLLISLFIFLPHAEADTIYLKNGRSIKGFVIKEGSDRVELDVGGGVVMFAPEDIEEIYKSTPEESSQMRERWQKKERRTENIRKVQEIEKEKERQDELEKIKFEQERKPKEVELEQNQGQIVVDVLINNKVRAQLLLDTGASFVVITEDIAKKLGIDITKENKLAKLQVADGRQVDAKYIVLKSVSIEGVQAQDVEATIMPKESAKPNIKDGLLGMSFLKKFNFKVDQGKKKIILEKYKSKPTNKKE